MLRKNISDCQTVAASLPPPFEAGNLCNLMNISTRGPCIKYSTVCGCITNRCRDSVCSCREPVAHYPAAYRNYAK